MYERTSRSQMVMFADRAMAFGSLIIGSVFAALGFAAAISCISKGRVALLPVALVACVAGVTSLWQVITTIMAMIRPRLPTAVQAALMQPRWPVGTRWIFAGWWLIHLAMGLVLAISLLEAKFPDLAFVFFSFLMSTAFTYAAYGFLMLATTCYTKRPDIVTRVWGWRVIWAYVHGVAVLVIGLARVVVG